VQDKKQIEYLDSLTMRSEEDRVRSNSVPEHRDTGYCWSRNNWRAD
jgi:hypothetical protein